MPTEPFTGGSPNAADAILENLLDAVLVVDGEGIIIYANRSALRLFEKPASELLSHRFGFPVELYEVQEINLLKGGQLLTVQMLASPIEWEGRRASLLSLRDITAQKRLLEELEEQKKLLERKNEESAQYAALASHDLKEPVRKILIYTDLLRKKEDRPPSDKEKIDKVHSMALRMNQLINGIAELSRVSYVEHSFQQVDLKRVVDEVCEDLDLQLREKEGIVETASLPVIEAMPDKIYQLFLNLISNSLKYARKNVKPCIRISGEDAGEDGVRILLEDNGIGFDNGSAAQLFQPFRRLHKHAYEGIGIGLSLCQRIVEMHGGEIKADGISGEGATFIILLPRRQNA